MHTWISYSLIYFSPPLFLFLCCATGNVFVIAAIILERNLQNVANYLVASLAVADLFVACLVMPLGAVYEVIVAPIMISLKYTGTGLRNNRIYPVFDFRSTSSEDGGAVSESQHAMA